MNKTSQWIQSLSVFLKPTNVRMLFLGFSAGLPILLIFSSLSLWLREAGVARSAVTFFSWAALGYSFKFIWAPLVDRLPLPIFNVMGRRRSWLLFSQLSIFIAIVGMSLVDPASGQSSLTLMAVFAVLLGFSSATQDIVIDAYRIESDEADMQAILSSTYIAGYRIGMVVAGAGALYLAKVLGSSKEIYSYSAWMWAYLSMAMCMLVGMVTTLFMPEPNLKKHETTYTTKDYSMFFIMFVVIAVLFSLSFVYSDQLLTNVKQQLVSVLGKNFGSFLIETFRLLIALIVPYILVKVVMKTTLVNKKMVNETYIDPVRDFFNRYGKKASLFLLVLIGLYRVSDIVLGVISNVFYQDLGFSKIEIAGVVKTFGLLMTLVGGFLGGVLTVRFGVLKILLLGAVLSAATNLLFMALAQMGHHLPMLYVVISADNLAAGLASAAFVAFLSSLTNISFTAVQYAIFSSLMTLLPKVLGGYSGSMVDSFGYSKFFLITTLMGVPVIYLVLKVDKVLSLNK